MFLYNKYRPQTFKDVFDQKHLVKVLKNSCINKRVGHAYLFSGPKGTGKTSLGRIYAKAINCLDLKEGEPCGQCANCIMIESNRVLDILEIDAASNTGVDNIRELKDGLAIVPTALKYKVYIIDEAHMLSKGAFNALLKALEEPPSFAVFILATTEINKIPETIISRCQKLDFKRISSQEIQKKLIQIAKQENVSIEKEAIDDIISSAEGGMRDAESLLGQIISIGGNKITAKETRDVLGIPGKKTIFIFLEALKNKDLKGAFKIVAYLNYQGYSLKLFLERILGYLRDLLILKVDPLYRKSLLNKTTSDNVEKLWALSKSFDYAYLSKIIAQFFSAKEKEKDSPFPQLPIELALVDLLGEHFSFQNTEIVEKQVDKKEVMRTDLNQSKEIKKSHNHRKGVDINEKLEKTSVNKLTLEKIKEIWPLFLVEAKKQKMSLWGILQNCKPVAFNSSGVLMIEVKYDLHKKQLEELNNRKIVGEILEKLLASKCLFCYFPKENIAEVLQDLNRPMALKFLKELRGEVIEIKG